MFFNIILLFIAFAVLYLGLGYTEPFVPANDVIAKHQEYIANSQSKFNSLTNTVNLGSPSISIDPISASNVQEAVATLVANPSSTGHTLTSTVPYSTPSQLPGTLELAQKCEAAPKSCAAFDDADFAKAFFLNFFRARNFPNAFRP